MRISEVLSLKSLSTLLLSLTSTFTIAAPILDIDESGQLMGATGVEVQGNVYDVSFVDTSCFETYGSCDSDTSFIFTTREEASAASKALLDTVFLDAPSGNFDTDPLLTNGCSSSTLCKAYTAFSIDSITDPINGLTHTYIQYAVANNRDDTSKTGISGGRFNLSIGADYGLDYFNDEDLWGRGGVFALWTPSQNNVEVSEPAPFALMLVGGLFLLGRKKPKKKYGGLIRSD